jgi:hypothetical protein
MTRGQMVKKLGKSYEMKILIPIERFPLLEWLSMNFNDYKVFGISTSTVSTILPDRHELP